jgi:hypothetical protein
MLQWTGAGGVLRSRQDESFDTDSTLPPFAATPLVRAAHFWNKLIRAMPSRDNVSI